MKSTRPHFSLSRILGLVAVASLLAGTPPVSFARSRSVNIPAPSPSPSPSVARTRWDNCPDLSDFIRSGGAIPVTLPDEHYSMTMGSIDFRHEQPSAGSYPFIVTHRDYGQQWVFHLDQNDWTTVLNRAYLPPHHAHVIELFCRDGSLAMKGVLENCDWYPQGMEIHTIGRRGNSCEPGRNWTIRELDGTYRDYEYVIDGGEFGGRLVPIENN